MNDERRRFCRRGVPPIQSEARIRINHREFMGFVEDQSDGGLGLLTGFFDDLAGGPTDIESATIPVQPGQSVLVLWDDAQPIRATVRWLRRGDDLLWNVGVETPLEAR